LLHVSVVGLARGPSKTSFLYGGETRHFNSRIFTNVVAAGSGAHGIASLIQRMEETGVRVKGAPALWKVVSYAMALGSQVAGIEYITQDNLLDGWGGGLEIAVFSNGIATKVGEILYGFWRCDRREDEWHLRFVPTFVKLEYQNDLMIMYLVSKDDGPRVSAIPTLLSTYRDGESANVQAPSLAYNYLCNSIVFVDDGKAIDTFSNIQGHGSRLPVNFVRTQSILPLPHEKGLFPAPYRSSTTMHIDKDYFNEMAELVRQRLGSDGRLKVVP
jgi:hypothetical protein